jgi:propanol-preferring alcohol dehydrogenase
MRAMVFDGTDPILHDLQLPDPRLSAGQMLIDVHACGVCRTDLHIIGRELAHPKPP